ncbi:protein kinase-like domain, concanavalin A-like lectin/glucanase domain protein [Tanacetum coccineum]
MDGNVHIFKARLVAKGYTQTYAVDYGETLSPVTDIRAIKILLAIAAFYDYEIWQMDVKTAFLNSHLSEDVYMVQPEGFVDPKHPNKLCKLQRNGGRRNTKDMVLVYGAKPEAELKVSCYADATEYIAAAKASMKAVWMSKFIDGLGDVVPSNKRPMEMLCDNEHAIAIAADPEILKGARHYQRTYHYIREGTIILGRREYMIYKNQRCDLDNAMEKLTRYLELLIDPSIGVFEDEREEKGNLENTNTAERKEEQRDTPQPELKDPTDIGKIVTSRNDEEREIKWLDIEEPLDLVDTSEESVYESLIKEMPKCSLNYDFRIKKDDPRNLKVPCMIGHKFMANAYIDVDLPMNIMSLTYYNSIRKSGYEYRGRNFKGLGRDMHVYVGNMSYVMDFTILENTETNIDHSLSHVVSRQPFVEIACLVINRKHGFMTFTDGTNEIPFKTSYKDPERNELSSEGHDLLSSRIILSEDDYDRGCRKPSDLEDRLYRDTIKLAPTILDWNY